MRALCKHGMAREDQSRHTYLLICRFERTSSGNKGIDCLTTSSTADLLPFFLALLEEFLQTVLVYCRECVAQLDT